MEKALKEKIVKSAAAVKRKVELIKDAKNTNNMTLETIFKPIIDPLNLIANKNDDKLVEEENQFIPFLKKSKKNGSEVSCSSADDLNEAVSEEEEDYSDSGLNKESNKTLVVTPSDDHNVSEGSFKSTWSSPNVKNQSSWSTSSEALSAIPFGVRNERGKLMLGNVRVFDNGDILKIGNHTFKRTVGLKELLFKKKPNLDVVTNDDLQNYKVLLLETNAHRRNFDASKQINSNKGFKYNNIIKPLFKFSRNATTSAESLSQGKGIELLKEVKKDIDYVYWDDPNELVERLKLLLASWEAGNTGLDNEIIAIMEELHEAGIINFKYKSHAFGKLSSILKADKASRLK